MNDVLRHMSIEQQVGQLLMVGFPGTRPTHGVLEIIQSGHVGGVILFSRNLRTPEQMSELTTTLQQAAREAGHPFPLLISTDQENGIVRRTGSATTTFPGNMALGAIDSEEATEAVARATGEELRALGITMNLAPVVDISNNPANPVIGVRSFGADPELVARLGAAATRGYQSAGVAATLKHFPGHGDTAVDSHLALPVVPFDIERLEAVELVPFRRAIEAGADAVMTAHVAMPAITGSSTLPATIAPEVLRGLLREQLGYNGVVITDCLEMRAISAGVGVGPGAVRALQAGADIVLVSHRHDRQMAALRAIRHAVEHGELAAETIHAAAERVLRLKQRLMMWDGIGEGTELTTTMLAEHQRLADDVYARSITLIRDEQGLLPLQVEGGVRLLVVSQTGAQLSQAADRGFSLRAFSDALKRELRGPTGRTDARVTTVALANTPTDQALAALRQRAARADVVILLTCNAHLPRRQASTDATVRALVAAGRPLVGIAACDPYDPMVLPQIGTWLATYDYMPPALDAAARVVLEKLPAQGRLPVTF